MGEPEIINCECSRCGRLHHRLARKPSHLGGDLSIDDITHLSRAFNETSYLAIGTQDERINEWLKSKIVEARSIAKTDTHQ